MGCCGLTELALPMWLRESKTEHIPAAQRGRRGSLVAACRAVINIAIFCDDFIKLVKTKFRTTSAKHSAPHNGGARARHQRPCLDDEGRWRGSRGRPRRDRATADRWAGRPTRWPFARVSHLFRFVPPCKKGTTSHSSPQARCFPGNALRRASHAYIPRNSLSFSQACHYCAPLLPRPFPVASLIPSATFAWRLAP